MSILKDIFKSTVRNGLITSFNSAIERAYQCDTPERMAGVDVMKAAQKIVVFFTADRLAQHAYMKGVDALTARRELTDIGATIAQYPLMLPDPDAAFSKAAGQKLIDIAALQRRRDAHQGCHDAVGLLLNATETRRYDEISGRLITEAMTIIIETAKTDRDQAARTALAHFPKDIAAFTSEIQDSAARICLRSPAFA